MTSSWQAVGKQPQSKQISTDWVKVAACWKQQEHFPESQLHYYTTQTIKEKKNLLSIKIGDIYHMTNNAQHLLCLCQVREWIRLAGFPLLSQTGKKTKLKDSFWPFQSEVGLVHAPWSCGGTSTVAEENRAALLTSRKPEGPTSSSFYHPHCLSAASPLMA